MRSELQSLLPESITLDVHAPPDDLGCRPTESRWSRSCQTS
jgi:hypothetical protein